MKFDVRALLAGEHQTISVCDTLTYPEQAEDGTYRFEDVTFLSAPYVTGNITGSAGCVSVELDISVRFATHCARCLEEIRDTFTAHYERTVASRSQLGDLTEEALDDFLIAEDGFIMLDEDLLDYLVLEFPFRLLCKEDCKGLCQTCGHNLNEGPCSCDGREIDPRLAPLQKWLDEHKGE